MTNRDLVNEEQQRHRLMCAHIKTALSTPSGKVLFQWLKENCFMDAPMLLEFIESAAVNQRVNARRDLFITLESIVKEGLNYVGSTDE